MKLIEGIGRNSTRDGFVSYDITAQANEKGLMVVTGIVLVAKRENGYWLFTEQHEVNDEVGVMDREILAGNYMKFAMGVYDKAFG